MKKLYIYIVDDEYQMALPLKRILHNIGHSICTLAKLYNATASNRKIAAPNLVLTDITTKGYKTGIGFIYYINQYLPIPLTFQSSVTSDDVIKKVF